MILWTHHIDPAAFGGEPLFLQVALDAQFNTLLVQARVGADEIGPERDHTVKIDLDGQLPAMASGGPFFYRFDFTTAPSAARGRCRTLPAANAQALQARAADLQDFTPTATTARWLHIARDDSIDHVLHLGDFIYETAGDPRFRPCPLPTAPWCCLRAARWRRRPRTTASSTARSGAIRTCRP